MKPRQFYVSFIMAIVALSAIPLQQVNAKGFLFGGQPDLRISLLHSDASNEDMNVSEEDFDLILDDMDRLPVLFGSTIFPAMKEQLLKHESSVKDHYLESMGVVYNLNEDTMDVNNMQIYIDVQPELISKTVNVEPPEEAKMSIVKRLGIYISVYAYVSNYEYEDILNEIEAQTTHRIKIVSSQAKQALNENRDVLLAGVLEGEGSLANKIRIRAISMEMLGDIVRIHVSYPDKDGRLRFIDEINPAIIMESQINSIVLGEPQLVTEHSSLNVPIAGRELIVQSELKNMVSESMRFTYIVQVRNQDGITVSLDSIEASVASNESINAALAWTPESAGTYEIQTFVWSDSASPPPLASSKKISIAIGNDRF